MAITSASERDVYDEGAVGWIKTEELKCGEGDGSEYQIAYYLPKGLF